MLFSVVIFLKWFIYVSEPFQKCWESKAVIEWPLRSLFGISENWKDLNTTWEKIEIRPPNKLNRNRWFEVILSI